ARRPTAALLLACLTVLASPLAHAGTPWEAPAFSVPPAELAREAARHSPPPDAPVDLLLQETHFEYTADGLETMRVRTLFRVLTPEAVRV
ncbi:hypothetical protein ACXYTC_22580, partial [Escherichia coli]